MGQMGFLVFCTVQSVLGYLAMFAAMTYSTELFAAVCLGATTGYAALHLDDAPAPSNNSVAARPRTI